MPRTDSLQPPLSKAERDITKSYGGWSNFMHSMGLKPWEDDDAAEGKAILEAFVRGDEENGASRDTAQTGGSAAGRAQGGHNGQSSKK